MAKCSDTDANPPGSAVDMEACDALKVAALEAILGLLEGQDLG